MTDFLAEIVRETRGSIGDPGYLAALPEEARGPRASLAGAIVRDRRDGALLIEHKRVSPGSENPRLPARSIEDFVRLGEAAQVSGYSCLAARPRFEGSPRDVAEIASRTDRPVLFKEFVVDPLQIRAAARAGASALLLIARLGEPPYRVPLRELAHGAHDQGLEVLLEFHHRTELRLADGVPADVFGVNARDLTSLKIDGGVAADTLRAAGGLRPLLGLSGVDGADAARRFWDLGVDGVLVGSAFARAVDPVAFLASLKRPAGGNP